MKEKTKMSEPRKRNWIPILIAGVGLSVVCMIVICVLLILLVLPVFDVEVSDLFGERTESTQEIPQDPGAAPSDEPEDPVPDESYQRALEMAGEWEGMWINNTFSSSGAASLIIEVEPSGLATLTLDLDGFVFGLFDPDPVVYTANFGGGRIDFDITDDPVFGDFLASGFSDGTVSIEAELIPVEGIASLTAEGTFAPRGIHLTYVVEFLGGGSAEGELNLTRGP